MKQDRIRTGAIITAAALLAAAELFLAGCADAALPGVSSGGMAEAGAGSSAVTSYWETIPDDRADRTGGAAGSPDGSEAAAGVVTAEDAAEGSTQDPAQGTTEGPEAGVTAANEPQLPAVTATGSSEELTALVNQFLAENGLNTDNFACAYLNLSTGETCYVNELRQFDAASTYKLPLNLLYYDRQAAGTISGSDIIQGTGTSLGECHHQSLEFSNNELSEAMVNQYGSYDVLKRDMRRYMTLTDAETADSYYHHNTFCARQIMDVSHYLYDHSGEYQEALGYLQAAQPGQYYKHYISGVTIAQKYGHRDGYDNCSGIVYGSTPFVLGVYSYNAGGEEMIGRLAQLFYQYSNQ